VGVRVLSACCVAAVSAAPASASVFIGGSLAAPTLRVDARGAAEIGWTEGGSRRYLVVPAAGKVFHGRLAGPDVSTPASVPGLAGVRVVRKGPGGTVWALQAWQPAGRPAELHLARWKGAPTQLTLADDGTHLIGQVTFQGRPVSGTSPTTAGKQVRIYVYLDCSGCAAGPGWTPMLGVAPHADGSFSVLLRPSWMGREYRASVEGPNLGATLAPDAQAVVAAPS
jgi:hypothetical protein